MPAGVPRAPRMDRASSVTCQPRKSNVSLKTNNQIKDDRREEGGQPGKCAVSRSERRKEIKSLA